MLALQKIRAPRRGVLLGLAAAVVAFVGACGEDVQVGDMGEGGSGGGGASHAGSAGSGAGAPGGFGGVGIDAGGSAAASGGTAAGGGAACVQVSCQNKVYLCGNCKDDDNDGLVDSEDPDCVGPCDNTEDAYDLGIPGGNQAECKMDCYFDRNSGNDDRCHWSHACDPLSMSPTYYPSGDDKCAYDASANIPGSGKSCDELFQVQDPECAIDCGPLTPNGCDCFGCCELPAGSKNFVFLGSEVGKTPTCTRDAVTDPGKCHPCTPVPSCMNDCGECELCVGKERPSPGCNPAGSGGAGGSSAGQGGGSGVSPQCAVDVQPCGLSGQGPCAAGYYCVTGCCVAAPR